MPPEEPHGLVALDMSLEGATLVCGGERVFPRQGKLRVSWYTASSRIPDSYRPILDGLVVVLAENIQATERIDRMKPTKVGERYRWRDQAGPHGLMIAFVAPPGYTIERCQPALVEAKVHAGRVAAFWLLFPPSETDLAVTASWMLAPLRADVDTEVERLNRSIALANVRGDHADYDVALSYASEDRAYVDEVATALVQAGVTIFYDRLEGVDLWGSDLYTYLHDVYRARARFTAIFVSQHHARKRWPTYELEVAQARALIESRPYLLPIRLDESEVPEVLRSLVDKRASETSPQEMAGLILQKLEATRT
jgi:hypothetical protein